MGRPSSGKVREYVRLTPELWKKIYLAAEKNHRNRDLQIEAILTEWFDRDEPKEGDFVRPYVRDRG